jgi:hypothetical protein
MRWERSFHLIVYHICLETPDTIAVPFPVPLAPPISFIPPTSLLNQNSAQHNN